jgi:hypothetical protein
VIARRALAGSLEQIVLVPPGAVVRGSETLEIALSHRSRFTPGLVELAVSVGQGLFDRSKPRALDAFVRELAAIGSRAGGLYAFIAEHDFTPSFLALTPFERDSGLDPARTLSAVRTRGRLGNHAARWVTGTPRND